MALADWLSYSRSYEDGHIRAVGLRLLVGDKANGYRGPICFCLRSNCQSTAKAVGSTPKASRILGHRSPSLCQTELFRGNSSLNGPTLPRPPRHPRQGGSSLCGPSGDRVLTPSQAGDGLPDPHLSLRPHASPSSQHSKDYWEGEASLRPELLGWHVMQCSGFQIGIMSEVVSPAGRLSTQ